MTTASRPTGALRRAALGTLGVGLAATLAATLAGPPAASGAPPAPGDEEDDVPTRVVMVDAPTVAQRNEVVGLGLDITEHVTPEGIEVILYDAQDARTLREAGYSWTVEEPDLEAAAADQRRADRRYAARVVASPLPSGRTAYRTYDDYLIDLDALAADYPG